ncbi:MAG: EAL domain-containing protein [Actinomycetota bacterium]|nr:EAL domain-containing protein [Actinomycetota bacterium]
MTLRLRSIARRVSELLPQGRLLPEALWIRRHRWITRFALVQAGALGVFALLHGSTPTEAAGWVGVIGLPALIGRSGRGSRRLRTMSTTVGLMLASAALVNLSDGMTESHFHFFVMLGLVALYQDWGAFGICILITVLHHAVMGTLAPHSVYGSPDEWSHPVRWAVIHGGFIFAASITHLIAWKANEQLELSDPLTRLANRAAFVAAVDRRLRDPGRTVSVLFVDLDNFKAINDSGGHQVGDLALRQAAQRMLSMVRAGDLVARLGGDEFAVLVDGDAGQATVIAQRISAHLQAPVPAAGREVFVRASIGVADSELARSRDYADLLRDAGLAMYLAKASGKNQVVIYTAGVDKAVRERAALAADIRHALAGKQLEVHYQPLVNGVDGKFYGVEALLRWHHPVRGLIPPNDFIPLAEDSGDIKAIGAWVLHTAAAQVVHWQRTVADCADLRLSVNLSPVQLADPDLIVMINHALSTTGLAPAQLTLEVTESMLLQDLDQARRQLEAARTLGAKVAIDDFGTGYSSLSYLAQLPADQVKIDRSFIRDLQSETGGIALVKGIIDMARALNLDILAEGVEIRQQQDILNDLGCPGAQGYLYSRPLPAVDFPAFATGERAIGVSALALEARPVEDPMAETAGAFA